MKRFFLLSLALALTACNLPRHIPPTPSVTTSSSSAPCAFVEGRQSLPDLSARFLAGLKNAALPVETARAEAYGENCVSADNSTAHFSASETDFYVTLQVAALKDQTVPGKLLEEVLAVIDGMPVDQLGPNPGYVGVTFQAGDQVQNLWFTRTQAATLQAQGVHGADLYRALTTRP